MRSNLKKMSVVVAITGALLLALAVVGFSQQGRGPGGPGGHGGPGGPPGRGFHGGPRGGGDGLGPLGRDLNLTDEQKAQIKKLRDGFEEGTKALREQLRTLHDGQPDVLSTGTFDEAAVRAAAEARAKVEVELEVAHVRLMSQISSVLTAEQKAQLAAKRQEHEQRRQEWESQRKDAPQQ